MPVILAIQEAEIRRFEATLAKSSWDPISNKTHHKKCTGEVAQVVGMPT
jgi:hypothetical protein